jgi:hypothetical protein
LGVFYIGESFLCPWLPEAIAEAKAVGFDYVFLTTNGSVATRERVQACMAAGLDSLKFSLNYADEGQFELVAHVKPSLYRRALNNIRAAREVRDAGGYACRIYASSIMLTGEQGEKMRRCRGGATGDEHWLRCTEWRSGRGGRIAAAGQPTVAAMRPPLSCWSVFTAHITAQGKLGLLLRQRVDDHQISFEGWKRRFRCARRTLRRMSAPRSGACMAA